jgi:hypothetical protein
LGLVDKLLSNFILNNKFISTNTEFDSTTPEEYISRLGGKYSHFDGI